MAAPLHPGTVQRATRIGLAAAQAERNLSDEDFIGPALAEPIAHGRPGLVIAVFPTVGRRPGGANLCRPVSLIIRISLPDATIAFTHPVPAHVVSGGAAEGYLGSFSTDPPPSLDQYLKDQADWEAALDRAANAVALNEESPDRPLLDAIYRRLPWTMLRPTYATIAPTFLKWLSVP
jgi:hypothetical protein